MVQIGFPNFFFLSWSGNQYKGAENHGRSRENNTTGCFIPLVEPIAANFVWFKSNKNKASEAKPGGGLKATSQQSYWMLRETFSSPFKSSIICPVHLDKLC